MCKIAVVAIISRISIFGTVIYPYFHNIPSSYFSEQTTNAILMRQAVFSYKERNKNPSSCAPLYTNLYCIKKRNSPLKK